jgi:aarF domain-containing kinase
VVKGIDAVSREQLTQLIVAFGFDRVIPSLSSVPAFSFLRPAFLLPSITAEDEVVLNNTKRVLSFLVEGTPAERTGDQVMAIFSLTSELFSRLKFPIARNLKTF